MSDSAEFSTIGQVARRIGLPVHTVRFWSDIGLVPPTGRSTGGYRLYDAAAVARFDLVRTLRELDVGLEAVKEILARRITVAEVAEAHARALDAEIRTLKLRRAVLRTIARHGGTTEETLMTHRLAQLSARERQQIIDGFVDSTFAGVELDDEGLIVAEWMRELPGELPDDPAPEQVTAWVELAELVSDEEFRRRARRIVLGASSGPRAEAGLDLRRTVLKEAGKALEDGIAPESAEGRLILSRVVESGLASEERAGLRDWLETVTDARMERYWQPLAALNGHEPSPSAVPAFGWVIAALSAHG